MTPAQRKRCQWQRCYRVVFLLHSDRAGERFIVAGVRVLRANQAESTALWELVDGFVAAVGRDVMKILVVDRGFIDGPQIGRLKTEYGIDTVIPIRSDMDILQEADIDRADAILAVTDDDKTNLLVSVRAKQLGCRLAIALINDPTLVPLTEVMDVDAYINPPDEDMARRLEADSAQEDATKRALLEMHSGSDADLLDQLRAARQRLDDERSRAESARAQAESAAAEVSARIES